MKGSVRSNLVFGASTADLFQSSDDPGSGATSHQLQDAEIEVYPSFFSKEQSDKYFEYLLKHVQWKQEKIKYYGKLLDLPRLTAWYGDVGKSYTYSGITVLSRPWLSDLLEIKQQIEIAAHASFNSVLLNLYRNEHDSVAWHSDDEPELGPNPTIGSVSFGETRSFHLRHKTNESLRAKIDLSHGSFLVMKGATQRFWNHQVAKTTRSLGPRINLTFRQIR